MMRSTRLAMREQPDLGWHVISGEMFLDALRRVEKGESADLVYAELWANARHEDEPPYLDLSRGREFS